MSFIGTLLGRRAAGRESWLVELRTARLRHLLGDLGAILDLSADADEKQDGDYILDRQYVISLAEQALDRADAVLFDLEVITGTRSSEAEERLLALHRAVQSALAKPAAADIPAAGEGLLADEPEYLLLREVRRELFAPTRADGEPAIAARCGSLVDLAHRAAIAAGEHVGALLRRDASALARAVPVAIGGAVRLALVDLGGALDPAARARGGCRAADVTGAALAALLAGVAEAQPGADVELHAAATAEHAFLVAARAGHGEIVADALLGASPETSHVFVASRGPAALGAGPIRLAGLTGTRVGTADVLWRRRLPAEQMREALRAAGRLAAGLADMPAGEREAK